MKSEIWRIKMTDRFGHTGKGLRDVYRMHTCYESRKKNVGSSCCAKVSLLLESHISFDGEAVFTQRRRTFLVKRIRESNVRESFFLFGIL